MKFECVEDLKEYLTQQCFHGHGGFGKSVLHKRRCRNKH